MITLLEGFVCLNRADLAPIMPQNSPIDCRSSQKLAVGCQKSMPLPNPIPTKMDMIDRIAISLRKLSMFNIKRNVLFNVLASMKKETPRNKKIGEFTSSFATVKIDLTQPRTAITEIKSLYGSRRGTRV